MPLPKGIKAALDAWKAGTGEFPGELDDGVFFPSTGAFDAEVGRKLKGREANAQKTATDKFLAELGLTDESEIAAVKETLDKSGVLKTETEKIKGELVKALKLLDDTKKDVETHKGIATQHSEKLKGLAKRDALMKFAPKTVSPDVLSKLLLPDLEVADDGTVTVKGGDGKKTVDALVEETLTANPFLKNPTFKEGTGTKQTPDPKTVSLPYKGPEKEGDKPLTPSQVMMNHLVATGVIPNPNVTPGSM